MIKEAEYNSISQTLTITFDNGKKMRFLGVSTNLYNEYLVAKSKSKFFYTRIKHLKHEEVVNER